jgi:hypothetical protein
MKRFYFFMDFLKLSKKTYKYELRGPIEKFYFWFKLPSIFRSFIRISRLIG